MHNANQVNAYEFYILITGTPKSGPRQQGALSVENLQQ